MSKIPKISLCGGEMPIVAALSTSEIGYPGFLKIRWFKPHYDVVWVCLQSENGVPKKFDGLSSHHNLKMATNGTLCRAYVQVHTQIILCWLLLYIPEYPR
jgi:hypothetical protein